MLKRYSIHLFSAFSMILWNVACTTAEEPKTDEIILPTDEIDQEALPEENPNAFELGNPDEVTSTESEISEPIPSSEPESLTFDWASMTVFFDYNDASLKESSFSTLQDIAEYLKNNTNSTVTIAGHCDERGGPDYNLALGERRAESVKDYLVSQGVADGQLSTISYGEERPRSLGNADSDFSENRRVEFSSP